MPKRVKLDCTLEIPTGTDRTGEFSSFNIEPLRAEVESHVFGDGADRYVLGRAAGTITGNVRPEDDQAFLLYLMQRMEDGAAVAVTYRPLAAAQSATNPSLTFNVRVARIPPLGGEHGAMFGEGNLQLKVDGAVTWADGTNTVVIGAAT